MPLNHDLSKVFGREGVFSPYCDFSQVYFDTPERFDISVVHPFSSVQDIYESGSHSC